MSLSLKSIYRRRLGSHAFIAASVLSAAMMSACSESESPEAQNTGGTNAGTGGAGGTGEAGKSTAGSMSQAGTMNTAGMMSQGGMGGAGGTGGGGAGGTAGKAGAGGMGGKGGMGGMGGMACQVPSSGGEDFSALTEGPLDIQGEDAMYSGSVATVSAGTGWEGEGYADMVGSEGSMLWLIDAPADGEYTITFRYTQDDARDMTLNVNCQVAKQSVPFNNTGSWDSNWVEDVSELVTLREGTNRIVLSTNGGSGPNFDKLIIAPPMCTVGAEPVDCEAEAMLMTGATGLASTGTGWTGDGFADMFGSEGAVHFVVDVETAGSYMLKFAYTQDDTRDMTLTVNGVEEVASLAFNNTNSWNMNWVADVEVEVELEAGFNSIRLATNGGSGPNFDKVTITPAAGTGAGGAGGGPG
jgi:hypothetical protein